jgi:hypothetical protein
MPAYIKFDGVDGESAHAIADWVVQSQLAGGGTSDGGVTDVDLAIRVVDTETSTGHAVTENESGLVYSGESGGMAGDAVGPFFAFDASFRGGVDVPASGSGGGAGKVSLQDVSLSTSVPKAAAGDTVELVEVHFSFRKIEIEPGMEDRALADADASALGNTYRGVTTIEQGVVQVEHATMMLSFQDYMA